MRGYWDAQHSIAKKIVRYYKIWYNATLKYRWPGVIKRERRSIKIEEKRFQKEELKNMNKTTLKITILTVLLATLLVLVIMPVKAYPRIVDISGVKSYGPYGDTCDCADPSKPNCGCRINIPDEPTPGSGGGTN